MNKIKSIQNGFLLFMKISLIQAFILTMTASLAAATNLSGQHILERKVSLDVEDKEIKIVLREISKQTSARFTYRPEVIHPTNTVSLSVKNVPLGDVLHALFGPEIVYKVVGREIVFVVNKDQHDSVTESSPLSNLQELEGALQITGQVIDDTGSPLTGVNVLIKGTLIGTSTDRDGHYTINVGDESAVLVFSFIGFKTLEQTIGARTVIDVTLESDIKSLEEIVVMGYGSQKKAAVSGSVVTLQGEDIVESGVTNLTGTLAGKTPGVIAVQSTGLVGQDNTKLYIRGKGTLGNTDALIVIDGITDRGDFARLNPEDIESISVLKDASAAIYGTRAANGVILVTTKRGSGKRTPKFNVTTSFTAAAPTVRMKAIDSWKWARYEKDQLDNTSVVLTPQFNEQQIEWLKDGSKPDEYPNTDWFDETIKDYTAASNTSISAQGGNDVISYFISSQYLSQEQIYKGDFPFKQIQVRGNFDLKLSEKLSLGLDLMNRREDGKYNKFDYYNGSGGYTGGESDQEWQAAAAGGNGFIGTSPWLVGRLSNGQLGKGAQPLGGSNPIGLLDPANGFNRIINDVLNTKITLNYDITEDLTFTAYGAFDKTNLSTKKFQGVFKEYLYNSTTDEFVAVPDGSKPNLKQRKTNTSNDLFNFKLTYLKSFGQHDIDAFVAYEQSKVRMDYIEVFRGDFGGNALAEIFAGSPSNQVTDGRSSAFGRQNYFGRVNYGFKETYLATFSLRKDGSNNFAEDHRFGTFPAVSAGWVISNEPFLKGVKAVDFLKFRASWGQMGNDNIEPFQYLSTYEFTDYSAWCCGVQVGYDFGDGEGEQPGFFESTVANPGVTWETAATTNFGIEGRLLNNTISIDVDVFSSHREGILIQRSASFPDYTGIVLPDENLGEVNNKGFEIQLGYQNQLSSDFSFFINGNISKATNEVVFLDEPAGVLPWQKWEGKPIDSFYGYQSNDLYRTEEQLTEDGWTLSEGNIPGTYVVWNKWFNQGAIRLVDQNDDGDITDADRVRTNKSLIPTTQYGINVGFTFKNFDISALIQGQAGGYYSSNSFVINHDIFDDSWSPENPDAKYPIATPPYGIGALTYSSDFWLVKSDYMRLKNVNVNYRIPKRLSEKLKIDGANVFLRGNNLAILKAEEDNIDPETASTTGNFLMKSVQLGINFNF